MRPLVNSYRYPNMRILGLGLRTMMLKDNMYMRPSLPANCK